MNTKKGVTTITENSGTSTRNHASKENETCVTELAMVMNLQEMSEQTELKKRKKGNCYSRSSNSKVRKLNTVIDQEDGRFVGLCSGSGLND